MSGGGAQGQVFKGTWEGRDVAMKLMNNQDSSDFRAELATLRYTLERFGEHMSLTLVHPFFAV